MAKRDVLAEMLRRYRDAECTLLHSENGSDGGVLAMPAVWNQSFRELERCLRLLSPRLHRQLLDRYVDPVISRRLLIGRKRSDGSVAFPQQPANSEIRAYAKLPDADRHANEWDVVLATWPSTVKAASVDRALDQLAELFRGEPYLPKDMMLAA